VYDDLTVEIQTDVQDYLAREAEVIRRMGITDVAEQGIDGYPATAILDEVGDDGDKIVVMATHGRAGIGRWVLGSVADRVVRHSPGPVVVVRPVPGD
jgi:nucleotide-binding universal stress UspA family protein